MIADVAVEGPRGRGAFLLAGARAARVADPAWGPAFAGMSRGRSAACDSIRWKRVQEDADGRAAARLKTPRRSSAAALSVARTLEKVAATGLTPLDYMLQVMRDESIEPAKRLDAAKAAAPYVHPRLASVAVGNQDDKPFEQVIRWALTEDEAAPDPRALS
jgi:hypothetical protein